MRFCEKCGKEINEEAVVCPFCGCATSNFHNMKNNDQPIIINNNNSTSSSSSAAAAAAIGGGRVRRHHSLALDILLIFCTGGLWIIWMVLRPKYY